MRLMSKTLLWRGAEGLDLKKKPQWNRLIITFGPFNAKSLLFVQMITYFGCLCPTVKGGLTFQGIRAQSFLIQIGIFAVVVFFWSYN